MSYWKNDLKYGVDYEQGPIGTVKPKFKFAIPYEYKAKSYNDSYYNVIFCDNPIIADMLLENYNGFAMERGGEYQLVDAKVLLEKEQAEKEQKMKDMWTDHYVSTGA